MDLTNKIDKLIDAVIALANIAASNPQYHSYNEIPSKVSKLIEELKEIKKWKT